jgi:hypothetical protein
MLTVAACLWDVNEASLDFSRCYDESWVTKLYRGYARNLTLPFRFVLFTDRVRDLPADIWQERLRSEPPSYGALVEPFRYGVPMILTGLDTIITGNIDHLAQYCLTAKTIALPRDPYMASRSCNGVALIPEGQQHVYRNWRGENDMEWLRTQDTVFIDDLFPGDVLSYKVHVRSIRANDPGDARIVYFHGHPKPHELADLPWIKEHWA